jgi:hypothetical protein
VGQGLISRWAKGGKWGGGGGGPPPPGKNRPVQLAGPPKIIWRKCGEKKVAWFFHSEGSCRPNCLKEVAPTWRKVVGQAAAFDGEKKVAPPSGRQNPQLKKVGGPIFDRRLMCTGVKAIVKIRQALSSHRNGSGLLFYNRQCFDLVKHYLTNLDKPLRQRFLS